MPAMPPWSDAAAALVDVATGRTPADSVVRGGRWVNVHSGEIVPDTDVAIVRGRFAYVGPDASHAIGPETRIVDAAGRYLVPGLIDAHMHVESGMVTVTEFARAVAPHGTTTMFIDPHEIANVLGLPGVRLMHDEAIELPLNVYVQMPSCVPSAPGLEHAGAALGVAEITEAMAWPNIIGLGEVMNFPGVANNDPTMLGEIAATRAAGKTVGGHYASPDLGLPFAGYVAGGAADDHEGTRVEDAIARVRQGMRSMLRLGSAWYDVAPQVKAITEHGLDDRYFVLCTDDSHPGTLVHDGHMNRVVRHAIAQGLRPMSAIRMATLNAAEHFGLERELGSITPGRRADLILTSDLVTLPIEEVFARGESLARNGVLSADIPPASYPASARDTVRLGRSPVADDFIVRAPGTAVADASTANGDGAGAGSGSGVAGTVTARVIGVVENQAPTRALQARLAVANDGAVLLEGAEVFGEPAADVCHIALVERHRGNGGVVNAFVSGFGYDVPCAMASTVAHDAHHMIVVGTDRADMALAANRLVEVGGGVVLIAGGEERAMVELPIAGLMSDERAERVADKAQGLVRAMRDCGCTLNNAYMQHSLLALVVIPELRISDVGLIDVTAFAETALFVDDPTEDATT